MHRIKRMTENSPSRSVLSAHFDAEAVLLEMDRKRYYRLNETGQAIWRAFEQGRATEEVVQQLVAEFEVDEVTASSEVERFIAELNAERLLRSESQKY
jgi:hypothetical protein